MTNEEINYELAREIQIERRITNKILKLIILAEDRKVHLERGFSNLHRWLVEEHKYSASAANRRIQAARLLRAVPTVARKIEEGSINLTTLAQAQSMIRNQEKVSKVTLEQKTAVVETIENLSALQVEQALMTLLPENISTIKRAVITVVDQNTQRLAVNFTNEEMALLQRAKEVLAHSILDGDIAKVLVRALKELIARQDPLQKKTATVSHRANRVAVIRRDHACCTFKEPSTGRVCGERFMIERDHIIPKANGGDESIRNGRALCRAHNQLMSEKLLGKQRANGWRHA